VVQASGCVAETGGDIVWLEVRIVGDNLLNDAEHRSARSDPSPRVADHRLGVVRDQQAPLPGSPLEHPGVVSPRQSNVLYAHEIEIRTSAKQPAHDAVISLLKFSAAARRIVCRYSCPDRTAAGYTFSGA